MQSSESNAGLARLSICALALAAAGVAQAAIIRVPADKPTIQSAINAAQTGDVVRVAAGTYAEHLVFPGRAITVISESGPDATIIDAQGQGSVAVFESFEPVQQRLSGFTLRNGWRGEFETGGGVFVSGENMPTIDHNHIVDNTAGYGGGVYVEGVAAANIHHNLIGSNHGVGVSLVGSPMTALAVADNVIEHNDAGGLFASGDQGATKTITRNVVRFNQGMDGAGMNLYANNADVLSVSNNLIHGNQATRRGGGVHMGLPFWYSSASFVNNTVADNSAPETSEITFFGYASKLTLANNIVYGTTDQPALQCDAYSGTAPLLDNNDVFATQAPPASGTCAESAITGSNRSVDPAFAKTKGQRPYQLLPASPLIDAGSNAAAEGIKHDLPGKRRIVDGGHGKVVDIGAYEYRPK